MMTTADAAWATTNPAHRSVPALVSRCQACGQRLRRHNMRYHENPPRSTLSLLPTVALAFVFVNSGTSSGMMILSPERFIAAAIRTKFFASQKKSNSFVTAEVHSFMIGLRRATGEGSWSHKKVGRAYCFFCTTSSKTRRDCALQHTRAYRHSSSSPPPSPPLPPRETRNHGRSLSPLAENHTPSPPTRRC